MTDSLREGLERPTTYVKVLTEITDGAGEHLGYQHAGEAVLANGEARRIALEYVTQRLAEILDKDGDVHLELPINSHECEDHWVKPEWFLAALFPSLGTPEETT